MAVERFSIVLDNVSGVFFAGQAVTGKVIVSIAEKWEKFGGLEVECQGRSDVKFMVGLTPRSSMERYYEFKTSIPSATKHLDAGQHEFPFSFILPVAIPSSYEGVYGHVRHILKVKIMGSSRKGFRSCKIPISVNSIVDLNTIPQAKSTQSRTESKTLGFWPVKSGPIIAKAWVDKTGYVPGETIYFNGQVENQSGKPMRSSRVQIVECVTFYAGLMSHVMFSSRTIAFKEHGNFNESDNWSNEPILIPPIPPSDLPHCKIIKIEYKFQFVIETRKTSLNLVVPLEIIIGNIPLRSTAGFLKTSNKDYAASLSSKSDLIMPLDFPDDLPLPSYEEAVFGSDNFHDDSDDPEDEKNGKDVSFKPRYITYYGNYS